MFYGGGNRILWLLVIIALISSNGYGGWGRGCYRGGCGCGFHAPFGRLWW